MKLITKAQRAAVAVALLGGCAGFGIAPSLAGEKQVVKAFSVVEATGSTLPAGADSTRMMGTLEGPFFIDTGQGPVDAGNMHCVANMHADNSSGRQAGEGSCVLTAQDGASLFAEWTCEGIRFVGCRGDFKITGGTGRLEGVSGGGVMTSRVSDHAVVPQDEAGMAKVASRGIVFWDEFVFDMP